MRKLAYIARIDSIQPIEGKDRIVLARVKGWQTIIRKDEFNEGDLCVFIETDAILPEKPEFEFLKKTNYCIKTMKMGGVLSQGLCLPTDMLPDGCYDEDEDVTQVLGIRQYEATMDDIQETEPEKPKKHYPKFLMRFKWFRKLVLPKKHDASFPSFISKTDEVRIQNIPEILNDKSITWTATEKLDGCSATYALVRVPSFIPFMRDKFEFIVCSRNRRIQIPDNSVYWEMARKYRIENVLRDSIGHLDWIAIQGEIVGPKIQGNKYHLSQNHMYVFNLIDPNGRVASDIMSVWCQNNTLNSVPIVEYYVTLGDTVEDVLNYAHGESRLAAINREGIVFRSQDGQRSFKAVDPLFLIEHNE